MTSSLRAVAALALLVMLFSGGCALLVFSNGESPYVNWELVALFSGPPFAIALLVWLLARKRWNRAA